MEQTRSTEAKSSTASKETPCPPILFLLTLSNYLCLGLPSGLFPSVTLTVSCFVCLFKCYSLILGIPVFCYSDTSTGIYNNGWPCQYKWMQHQNMVEETNIATRKAENRKCRKHAECNIITPLAKEIAGKANAQKWQEHKHVHKFQHHRKKFHHISFPMTRLLM